MLAVKKVINKYTIFNRVVKLMGNRFEISVVGNHHSWAEERIDSAVAEINRIEKLLSAFTEDSIITNINRNAGVKPVKVSGEIYRLINRALNISELTQGAFDITYTEKSYSKNCKADYRQVVLDASNTTVFLSETGMRIGFGAIIKGYAADRAKYAMQMEGVSSGVINAGGDMLTWGLQPDNEPWTTIAAGADQRLPNVDITNMAIATSGNTEKYAVLNNNADGGNGVEIPVNNALKSVSIISPSAELADAMATPIMMMGIKAGISMINQLQQLACVIVDDTNSVFTSNAIQILS